MAYGLKYSQYVEKGGATLQIRVYVKDYSGASYGMAHITGAAMQIIGGQSDPLTPIIKTSFSWSLADCWDEGTTAADGTTCVNAQGEKCGKWEEFYTPDATKFRVELWAKTTPSATAACIWTGFVTPDSWSENMTYRGSITITARDMLGALREKEFNLIGRVSILDIVQGALSACAAPMALSYTAGRFLVNSNGQSILAHTIAASTFSGDTWQTALEDTLESLGLVLRYNGANELVLAPLRYVREDTTSGSHTLEFTGRSGLRELVPALREIVETFDVDFVQVAADDPDQSRFTATGSNIVQRSPCAYSLPHDVNIPGYTLTAPLTGGWFGSLALPHPTQVSQLGGAIPDRGIYFPTDIITDGVSASWCDPLIKAPFSFRISQDGPVMRYTINGSTTIVSALTGFQEIILSKIKVVVRASVNGEARYLNTEGQWQTTQVINEIDPSTEINIPTLSGGADYTIEIRNLITEYTGDWQLPVCTAVALNLDAIPAQSSTTPTEYKTKTIYNEENNVVITRSPKIGSASTDFCTPFCENVLAYGDAIAPDAWNWPGASTYYPLAVMIQAQMLCYHAAAASVFTGTAHDKTTPGALPFPGCAYGYYQRSCILISGTYDFASGLVGQVNIREVYSWADVWGAAFAPQYTTESGSGKGSTSATGAGGSSVTPGQGAGTSSGGGTNYFERDAIFDNGIALKAAYDALRVPGLIFGDGTAIDMDATTLPTIGAALQSLQSQIDSVASREHFDEMLATTIFADQIAADTAYASRYYLTHDVYFYVEVINNIPCVKLNAPFITDGDQIVQSGTPGGGGGTGYLSELADVSLTDLTAGQMLQWNGTAWVNIPAPTGSIYSVALAAATTPGSLRLIVNGVPGASVAVPGLGSAAYKAESYFALASHTHAISDVTGLNDNLGTISEALQSLQAQVDSVAARSEFDELTATSLFSDVLAASNGYFDAVELAGDDLATTLSGLDTAISNEATARAAADTALSNRATTLEGYFDASGNAKKALQLANARTFWGQSFDGTANVSGSLADVTSITASGLIKTTNYAQAVRFYLTDSIYFYKDTMNGVDVIRLNAPFVTDGDQIVQSGTPGGGGGGAQYLSELLDVAITSSTLVSGQVLQWDGTAWVNGSVSGGTQYVPGTGISISENTIAVSATYQGYISHGETAYGWGNHANAGYLLASTASTTYQPIISDLSTIRSNAANGNTAYGWGNHALAGYLTSANGTTISEALQSLQSQIDSVAARTAFDELVVTALYADTLSATSGYFGTLTGNLTGNVTGDLSGNASTATYATSAGSATNATNATNATYDSASENIASCFGIVSEALQSMQAQVDSIAARFGDGLVAAEGFFDMLSATNFYAGAIALAGEDLATKLATFVTLATAQTITGAKTFSALLTANAGVSTTTLTASGAIKSHANGSVAQTYLGVGAIGFNRNTDTGAVLQSGIRGGQIHVDGTSGTMLFGLMDTAGTYSSPMYLYRDGGLRVERSDWDVLTLKCTDPSHGTWIKYHGAAVAESQYCFELGCGAWMDYFYLGFISPGGETMLVTVSNSGVFSTVGDQVVSSDETKKTNLQPVNYTIADIAKCRAVTFDWKDGRGHSAGSIAQDWKPLIPELVHGEEGSMTLAYGQIALVNTVLEARAIENLEARILRLEMENAAFRTVINRLQMN